MNKNHEERNAPQKRIIDANLNRLREGIRVVEDICRYIFNSQELSLQLKNLRHLAKIDEYKTLLQARDIINDPLKASTSSENSREDINSILLANLKRAQESSRVLEEIFKLEKIEEAQKFKNIRYDLYNIEKKVLL
jgi:thiamine-phosphate pyrophosphorylase